MILWSLWRASGYKEAGRFIRKVIGKQTTAKIIFGVKIKNAVEGTAIFDGELDMKRSDRHQ